jgi:hypothetical protein
VKASKGRLPTLTGGVDVQEHYFREEYLRG